MTRKMTGMRFPPALLKAFDRWWRKAGYKDRTHAVENLMKEQTRETIDHHRAVRGIQMLLETPSRQLLKARVEKESK